ncbi:MAG TPA: bacterial transcriptional activator domain-containing protein [Anaerolineae bacterium]
MKHLQQVQEIDFLNEEICRQLMRLLGLSGRRNDALRQYEHFRQMLWDELGAEPEESTQSLSPRRITARPNSCSNRHWCWRKGLAARKNWPFLAAWVISC